jgi:hypothetical protein
MKEMEDEREEKKNEERWNDSAQTRRFEKK